MLECLTCVCLEGEYIYMHVCVHTHKETNKKKRGRQLNENFDILQPDLFQGEKFAEEMTEIQVS